MAGVKISAMTATAPAAADLVPFSKADGSASGRATVEELVVAGGAATLADVAAAVSALVNAAPGALDTLYELAAALGDDANFAATITAALAGKQPLDSDLTSIAALTTTSFGRSLLELANAAALRAAFATGTPDGTKFLRDDGAWIAVSGGSSYPTPAPLAANIRGYGLPGRPLVWGGTAMAQVVGDVFCDPFTVTESVDFDAYDFRADTGVASTLADIAVFSCANWKVGTTMTKVSGTETTGTSVATSGIKTPTLGATKTLTPGRYVLVRVFYGGASAVNLWYATSAQGYLGVRPAYGTGAHQEGWVQAVGASSLAASYTITNAAATTGVPVVLRRV